MKNGTVVRRFKWWFVWQEEAIQQWLQEMAAQGLHLLDTNAVGIHTFVRGAPAEMVYRWDVGNRRQDPHYMQLFQDAGWEYVASTSGWHCWRKAGRAGQLTEIFTDNASKISKYQRMMVPLSLALLANLVLCWSSPSFRSALMGNDPAVDTYTRSLMWLGVIVSMLVLYGMLKLLARTLALKRQRP